MKTPWAQEGLQDYQQQQQKHSAGEMQVWTHVKLGTLAPVCNAASTVG